MAHSHALRENPGQIAGIAALSAVIGAITALLFTPRTGMQARSGIRRRAIHGKDAMMERIHSRKDELADTIEETKEKAKDKTADLADKTKTKTGRR